MTGVLVELTVPLGALGLTRAHTLPERTRIEFERTASVCGCGSPSIWISGDRVEAAVAVVRESPLIEDCTLLGETGDGSVYQLTWDETLPGLIEHVRETDGAILSAIAVDDTWTVELRFPDRVTAAHFYSHYDDPDHPITIRSTSSSGTAQQARRDLLTAEQRDALGRAIDAGYFDVPRKTTLVELARELDVSDTAVSQRLRRGLSSILRGAVYTSRESSQPSRADQPSRGDTYSR